jgi:cyclic pyranopterin phosphate synthase
VLEDGFGRRFRYLRLSVTEACNYRCTYCLPNGYRKTAPHDFLSVAEVGRLVGAFVAAGVSKVRLTGGEPSVRRDLEAIITTVTGAGAKKVALTTNGWSLARRMESWTEAGLTHLNVSVDSLDPAEFARITGRDDLPVVLAGVERALACGKLGVKLNAVLLKEGADRSLDAFAAYVRARPVSVRFIELMRTVDNGAYFETNHQSGSALREKLARLGWTPVARAADGGPALEFAHPDHLGRIGFIEPYAHGFCDSCNRLRVTARGRLRLCLFGDGGLELRDLLQCDDDAERLVDRIRRALSGKSAGHRLREGDPGATRNLAQVGG